MSETTKQSGTERPERKPPTKKKWKLGECPNCGHSTKNGGHFVPPSFGDEGMFVCANFCDECKAAQPPAAAGKFTCTECHEPVCDHVADRLFAMKKTAAAGSTPREVMPNEPEQPSVRSDHKAVTGEHRAETSAEARAPETAEHSSHKFHDAIVCETCNSVYFNGKWHEIETA